MGKHSACYHFIYDAFKICYSLFRATQRKHAPFLIAPSKNSVNPLGDRSLNIDLACEDIVFDLCRKYSIRFGVRFMLLSEERATLRAVGPKDATRILVILDPIDGSLNALRRISPSAMGMALFKYLPKKDRFLPLCTGILSLSQGRYIIKQAPRYYLPRSHPSITLKEAVFAVDLKYKSPLPDSIISLLNSLYDVRRYGANLIDMTYVALRRLDGFVDIRGTLSIVHIAGLLLAKFMNVPLWARISSPELTPRTSLSVVIARTPSLLKETLDLLSLPSEPSKEEETLLLRFGVVDEFTFPY